jgi:hypothetical protein
MTSLQRITRYFIERFGSSKLADVTETIHEMSRTRAVYIGTYLMAACKVGVEK